MTERNATASGLWGIIGVSLLIMIVAIVLIYFMNSKTQMPTTEKRTSNTEASKVPAVRKNVNK